MMTTSGLKVSLKHALDVLDNLVTGFCCFCVCFANVSHNFKTVRYMSLVCFGWFWFFGFGNSDTSDVFYV